MKWLKEETWVNMQRSFSYFMNKYNYIFQNCYGWSRHLWMSVNTVLNIFYKLINHCNFSCNCRKNHYTWKVNLNYYCSHVLRHSAHSESVCQGVRWLHIAALWESWALAKHLHLWQKPNERAFQLGMLRES